ncbi:glutamyl-tRNA(Gln) amidotransferase subunit C, chloroplastic/mitochondrial [Carica papaya]|uniref:glutamyl-tRNA(Gln) amidotransferase subunit C, chloroplastic/mitochondrial n=1 Tax=Carica papaya TaxID=3649 RepID=UPI000B8CD0A9|nr:glutamyl-tRNA(Gln) amidotransferase subunit C, chloroplastic/mitochondrial [Carica papaya]XP_021902111.1 glutamyl-tRNA(Gln) amidotransferase subunit C, chloroplastic/mitochondrial [Carica papaya]
MGSRALLVLKAASTPNCHIFHPKIKTRGLGFSSSTFHFFFKYSFRNCSSTTRRYSLQPPDVPCLAETARISLNPNEVEEFAPKIRQVVDWFGQLQAVDLSSVEPAIRADTEGDNFRGDLPETFENREAMVASVPSYEEPYIKVPKVLNKE